MMVFALLLTLAVPDRTLTPGLVRPLSTATVCATKWGRDRRHVTEAMRRQVFAAYGIAWANRAQYEVDHDIPRELAGADAMANLWPQPLAEARIKDREENRLHRAVCAGQINLISAQEQMRRWGR